MTIRPFTENDYPALVKVGNAVYPDYPETIEEARHYDSTRPEKIRWGRLLAEQDGNVVGVGFWGNSNEMFHPQKFGIDVSILPEMRGQGIGKALYDACAEAMQPYNPILYRTMVREDSDRGLRFVQERGFTEAMREWESRFDPKTFERAAYSEAEARVADQGIRIHSLKEIMQTPDWEEKLYELDCAVVSDMPMTDTYTKPAFTDWRKSSIESPGFWPEGFFVALDGDRFVGESTLWTQQSGPDLYVGATGVLPEYRRKGIALALKVHACQAAKDRGTPELKTWNASTNVGMLSINIKLGFVRVPAWINFEKTL